MAVDANTIEPHPFHLDDFSRFLLSLSTGQPFEKVNQVSPSIPQRVKRPKTVYSDMRLFYDEPVPAQHGQCRHGKWISPDCNAMDAPCQVHFAHHLHPSEYDIRDDHEAAEDEGDQHDGIHEGHVSKTRKIA